MWFICLLYAASLHAQHTVSCRVVDSQTGESLPYVSVYVSPGKGTMTNEDGYFSLEVSPKESVRVSSIGYQTQMLSASNVPSVIRMLQSESVLREVTVVPIKSVLESVVKKLDKDFIKKNRTKSNFFLRQSASFSRKEEIVEAYVSAFSSVCLRNVHVLNGHRYARTRWSQSESSQIGSNLQHLMEMGPRICEIPFWSDITFPLGIMRRNYYWDTDGSQKYDFEDDFPMCLNHYATYVKSLTDDQGREIYEIHLRDKENRSGTGTVTGVLYVDAKDYSLLQFDGESRGLRFDMSKDMWTATASADIEIHSRYTHSRGFTEVEYVVCNMKAAGMKCRSVAYNLGTRKIKPPHGGKGVRLDDNLLDAIDRAGYDSTLWRQTCILRTAEEERIVRESKGSADSTLTDVAQADTMPRLRAGSVPGGVGFTPLVQRLRAFGRTIPQEKVYVHMDNTCYQLGDTIWFSAYTRRTDTGRPSDVSGVLYVELYGQDGYLVERKLVQMHDGQGDGFFALNKMIQYAGLYELRAYTRWQLNWGAYERRHSPYATNWFDSKELERAYFTDYEKLYSRVFPVYDRPRTPDAFDRESTMRAMRRTYRRNRDRRTLCLRLYPEGGALVSGMPCRMAFEAVWDDGEWAEGRLHVDGDSALAVSRGRGTITLTPTEGKRQTAVFTAADGTVANAAVPDADTLGVALSVRQDGMRWTARMRATPNMPDSLLAATLMHEGRLVAFWPVDSLEREGADRLCVLADTLLAQSGVYQMTVFDTSGRVYADRLFFARTGMESAPTVTVQGLEESYMPYAPVRLKVKAVTADSRVSLSVRDDNTRDFLHDNGTMLTEMLLASEIRGFVPDPGWFFQQDDSAHNQALDLLMMTQGWRRFRWQDMAVRGTWDLSQPAEQAPVLRGGVYKRNSSMDFGYGTVLRPDFSSFSDRADRDADTQPLLGKGTDRRTHDPAEINRSVPRDWAAPNGQREARQGEGTGQELAQREWERQEARDRRRDREYSLSRQYRKADRDVKVHAELVSMDGTEILVNERATSNGRFQIQLPPFYGKAILFLSAADTTKWSRRKSRRYEWVQGEPYAVDFDPAAPLNRFKKARFDVPYADYISRLRWPHPHFVQPYSHYQSTLAVRPHDDGWSGSTDSVTHMREVKVHARRSRMARYDDSQPIMVVDIDEASNVTFDAGMYSFLRYMVGDYGMDYPYVGAPDWNAASASEVALQKDNFEVRFGISPKRRVLPPYRDMLAGVPADSLYARKYLISFPTIPSQREELRYYSARFLDKVVFSTDYSPRMPGNWRYQGTDLPVTTEVLCPSPDEEMRMLYRDRRYVLQGFAYPAEFYSPDYSQGILPSTPTDYRRTLYWNPHLQLDSNGEATVTFYNCARTTEPSVDVQGQAHDGTPLWNR